LDSCNNTFFGNENFCSMNGHDHPHVSSSGRKKLLALQDQSDYSTDIAGLTTVFLGNGNKFNDLFDTKLNAVLPNRRNNPDLVRQSPKIIDLIDTDTGFDEDSSYMDHNAVLSNQGNNPDLGRQSHNRSAGPTALLGNITNTVVSDSRLLTPRNPSSPVSFTPMASSSSSQPMSPVVRKVKDQESSNRTSVSPLQQDSASQVALKICPLLSEGGVFSLENTSSSILTRIRLHDVNHFTFDNDLPLIGINGEEEMEFDIFGDHPICSPIVRMPLKKRLLARKEHEDVLAGGG